jgi:hypothetical protein
MMGLGVIADPDNWVADAVKRAEADTPHRAGEWDIPQKVR